MHLESFSLHTGTRTDAEVVGLMPTALPPFFLPDH